MLCVDVLCTFNGLSANFDQGSCTKIKFTAYNSKTGKIFSCKNHLKFLLSVHVQW
jgi:hypothetical protein